MNEKSTSNQHNADTILAFEALELALSHCCIVSDEGVKTVDSVSSRLTQLRQEPKRDAVAEPIVFEDERCPHCKSKARTVEGCAIGSIITFECGTVDADTLVNQSKECKKREFTATEPEACPSCGTDSSSFTRTGCPVCQVWCNNSEQWNQFCRRIKERVK